VLDKPPSGILTARGHKSKYVGQKKDQLIKKEFPRTRFLERSFGAGRGMHARERDTSS